MDQENLSSADGGQAANHAALAAGTILDGKYRIESFVGGGGMGSVYRAHHLELDKEVAIKTMHPRFSADAESVARFQREAHIICELHHKNILAVYAFGIDKQLDLLYMAMEFVQGQSLGRLIAERGAISPQQALPLLMQICDAMAYAHANNVLHRDLKPDNVLIANSESGEPVVKVVDFGLAKITDAEMQKLTSTGIVVGDPYYMSPEQAQGRTVDARSDIYSFGCLMYEVLTGERPFVGESTVAILYKQIGESPPPFPEAKTNLARSCHSIVFEAMQKSVDKRYQSFADIGQQLAKLHADPDAKVEGIQSVPTSRGISSPSRMLSTKTVIRVLAVVLLVAVLPAVSFLILNPRKVSPTKVEPDDGYSTLSTADVRARVNQLLSLTRDSEYQVDRAESAMRELEIARKHIGEDPFMQGRIDAHHAVVLRLRMQKTNSNAEYTKQIAFGQKAVDEFDTAARLSDAGGRYTAVNQTASLEHIRKEQLWALEVIRETAQEIGDRKTARAAANRILELWEHVPTKSPDPIVESAFDELLECSLNEDHPEEVEKIAKRAMEYYQHTKCDVSFIQKQKKKLDLARSLATQKLAKQKHHPN